MEFKQNWHKFNQLLGPLPPSRSGIIGLHSDGKFIAGAVGGGESVTSKTNFVDEALSFENVENAWEVLSHKYSAQWGILLERAELMQALGEVAAIKSSGAATENYYNQVRQLKARLKMDPRDKQCATFGEKEMSLPREHFLLSFFRTFFSELLPDRKLLLVGIVKGPKELDSVLLEFQGKELSNFYDPDFTGLEFVESDLFARENLARLVLWCENQAMLPAYALMISGQIWQECKEIQEKSGERQAWRHLLKSKRQRDSDPEVLFEPEPWPVKALLQWHAWRG